MHLQVGGTKAKITRIMRKGIVEKVEFEKDTGKITEMLWVLCA